MYQFAVLMVVAAMFLPWTGPGDPGRRIAAADAADGLAEQGLIYHQAALAAVANDPAMAGAVPIGALPDGWTGTGIAA